MYRNTIAGNISMNLYQLKNRQLAKSQRGVGIWLVLLGISLLVSLGYAVSGAGSVTQKDAAANNLGRSLVGQVEAINAALTRCLAQHGSQALPDAVELSIRDAAFTCDSGARNMLDGVFVEPALTNNSNWHYTKDVDGVRLTIQSLRGDRQVFFSKMSTRLGGCPLSNLDCSAKGGYEVAKFSVGLADDTVVVALSGQIPTSTPGLLPKITN